MHCEEVNFQVTIYTLTLTGHNSETNKKFETKYSNTDQDSTLGT
jgi:hypothetical protein